MPMTSHRAVCLSAFLMIASLQGCAGGGTEPIQEPPLSLAEALLAMSSPQLSEKHALPLSVYVPLFEQSSISACGYESAIQRFVCPIPSTGATTFEHSYALFDSRGNAQSAYEPSTTASIQIHAHIYGSVTNDPSSATLDDEYERTLSGLLTSRRVLNGRSTSTMRGMLQLTGTAPTLVNTTSTTVIDNLVLPSSRKRWPASGTITVDMANSFGGPVLRTTIRATFDGTKCVALSITYEGFTHTSMIDLTNAEAQGCTP